MGNDCGVPRLRRPAREDGGGKAPCASSPGYDPQDPLPDWPPWCELNLPPSSRVDVYATSPMRTAGSNPVRRITHAARRECQRDPFWKHDPGCGTARFNSSRPDHLRVFRPPPAALLRDRVGRRAG